MKAIALISGGLDSILAARIIKEQGIEVVPLNFHIPFHNQHKERSYKDAPSIVKDTLNSELKTIDISNDFLRMLENPVYGFGSNMNPCIDCKILMLSKAKNLMEELGARFIVTGEVLGQRPMSQHRQALEIIEKKSGLQGLLLRPLSALHLNETTPEREGWVERKNLLNFSGRGRTGQLELAKSFDIKDYPNPAGGCLLTDPEFSKRLKEAIGYKELNYRNVELLKLGRHFRLSKNAKLVVGRNERENESILNLAQCGDYCFMPQEIAGPTCLGVGNFNKELIELSSGIARRYCDCSEKNTATILYRRLPDQEGKYIEAPAMDDALIISYRI